MSVVESRNKYQALFFTDEEKARAFDKIAEKYYCMNFGSTSKSDLDVLMFSIYIEQILKQDEADLIAYSDYTLSKLLGITQSKVSNLKVRKQLLYPYEDFDWIVSLQRIADRAVFENGKIKLFIPDKNLYLEVKNAIEEEGGFVEVQLTSNLLQVRVEYFIDLILMLDKEKTREEARKIIKQKIESSDKDIKIIEQQPFGKALANVTIDVLIEIIDDCIPVFGGPVKIIAEKLLEVVRQQGRWI